MMDDCLPDMLPLLTNKQVGQSRLFLRCTDRQRRQPADKPLTVVAYRATPMKAAYVEPVAVGDELPSLPIFLLDVEYVPCPLEETYRTSWAAYPADFKELLE